MTTETNMITNALAKAMCGDAAPSFTATEFQQLVTAIRAATVPGADRAVCQAVGLRAMFLLLELLQASMQAERELAILRDASRPC